MNKKWFIVFCTSVVLLECSSSSATSLEVNANHKNDFDTEAIVIDAIHEDSLEDIGYVYSGKKTRNGKQHFLVGQYLVHGIAENQVSPPIYSPMHNFCRTNQGNNGNCQSFENCYPLLNLPENDASNVSANYGSLQEEIYQFSVDRKCSSVVHAGTSKFSNVCCDIPLNEDFPEVRHSPNDNIDENDDLLSPKYAKIVNQWATCGEKQFDAKIIGGEETKHHEFPWMVSLWGKSNKHICGASLLDKDFVITASHCVARYTREDVGKIRLLIGDHNIHSSLDGHHEVRHVSRIIKHKRFSLETFTNDIALLKLDRPVPFTDRIRPICLPSGVKQTDNDLNLVVTGWGQTVFRGASSSVLRKVEIPGVTNERCGQIYNSISPAGITEDMICAGAKSLDSCIGDSGGPLIQLVNNRYEQVGIVSFGRDCGTYPGVYTKVYSFLNWINVNRNKY